MQGQYEKENSSLHWLRCDQDQRDKLLFVPMHCPCIKIDLFCDIFSLWPVVSDYGLSKCLNNYNESRMLRRRAGLSIKGGAANCLMIQTTGLQGYSCVLSGV